MGRINYKYRENTNKRNKTMIGSNKLTLRSKALFTHTAAKREAIRWAKEREAKVGAGVRM
jgi:hypothetical protein